MRLRRFFHFLKKIFSKTVDNVNIVCYHILKQLAMPTNTREDDIYEKSETVSYR